MQALALEILLVAEERIKAREFVDRFKLALVGNDPKWVSQMFPNWVRQTPEEPEPVVEQVEDDTPLSDTAGEWHFTEKVTPEEADRVLREMLANPGGTMTLDEIEEGWQ